MSRKNIFQLVEENYNIPNDIINLYHLFTEEQYFCIVDNKYGYESITPFTTLKGLIDDYLLEDWQYRDTCCSVDDFLKRADANINEHFNDTEERYINYLETMENFIKLYFDNEEKLKKDYKIEFYTTLDNVFVNILRKTEKRMGLSRREYKDKVILYPENVALEKALETVSEEDVQWELIKYTREDLTLVQKKKSLSFLSTNLSIQKDKNEKNAYLNELLNKSCNILNNLHIRHDNMSGKSKNTVVESLTEEEQSQLCDMLYDMMLNILIARDLKKYDAIYNKFNSLQKN